ncbi:MAG: YceD family protein [bacterium]
MNIQLKEIPEEGCTIASEVPKTDFNLGEDEVRLQGPVSINIKINKSSRGIIISGKVKTLLELECSRCLENFLFHVNEQFEACFIPEDQKIEEEEVELTKNDMDVSFFKGEAIDLTDVIREQILLSVPMTPVCKSSCRGLCSNCGQNLNQGKCACGSFSSDRRWSALSKLNKNN